MADAIIKAGIEFEGGNEWANYRYKTQSLGIKFDGELAYNNEILCLMSDEYVKVYNTRRSLRKIEKGETIPDKNKEILEKEENAVENKIEELKTKLE